LIAAGFDFTSGDAAKAYNALFTVSYLMISLALSDDSSLLQQTTYIIGYADKPRFQFQYQWWIIEFEFFIFAITAFLTLFPRHIPRGRIVALTFLASAFVLVMDNINAIWFLLRNDTALMVYQEYRIQTAQAGLLMVGIGNALTVIFMGLYEHPQETKEHGVDATVIVKNPLSV
jgi:hypothetical protein